MSSEHSNEPDIDPQVSLRFYVYLCAIPLITVLLHLLLPDSEFIRAVACGAVVLPAELFLMTMMVVIVERRGSIISAWTIILPIAAAWLSFHYGWWSVVWVLGGYTALICITIVVSFITVNRINRE